MYIPHPAKLLFTIDDSWNTFLEKFGDNVTPWTRLCVERMLACGTASMGVRRYCCASADCTHSRFFCQSCKSKASSACGFKATEKWVSQQSHTLPDCDWQHITFGSAVQATLEGPFCEEDPGCLEKCQIPRPIPEATTGVGSEAEALQRRCRGASLLRPPYAAVPAADADAGGDDRALYQSYPGEAL